MSIIGVLIVVIGAVAIALGKIYAKDGQLEAIPIPVRISDPRNPYDRHGRNIR